MHAHCWVSFFFFFLLWLSNRTLTHTHNRSFDEQINGFLKFGALSRCTRYAVPAEDIKKMTMLVLGSLRWETCNIVLCDVLDEWKQFEQPVHPLMGVILEVCVCLLPPSRDHC